MCISCIFTPTYFALTDLSFTCVKLTYTCKNDIIYVSHHEYMHHFTIRCDSYMCMSILKNKIDIQYIYIDSKVNIYILKVDIYILTQKSIYIYHIHKSYHIYIYIYSVYVSRVTCICKSRAMHTCLIISHIYIYSIYVGHITHICKSHAMHTCVFNRSNTARNQNCASTRRPFFFCFCDQY